MRFLLGRMLFSCLRSDVTHAVPQGRDLPKASKISLYLIFSTGEREKGRRHRKTVLLPEPLAGNNAGKQQKRTGILQRNVSGNRTLREWEKGKKENDKENTDIAAVTCTYHAVQPAGIGWRRITFGAGRYRNTD